MVSHTSCSLLVYPFLLLSITYLRMLVWFAGQGLWEQGLRAGQVQ